MVLGQQGRTGPTGRIIVFDSCSELFLDLQSAQNNQIPTQSMAQHPEIGGERESSTLLAILEVQAQGFSPSTGAPCLNCPQSLSLPYMLPTPGAKTESIDWGHLYYMLYEHLNNEIRRPYNENNHNNNNNNNNNSTNNNNHKIHGPYLNTFFGVNWPVR